MIAPSTHARETARRFLDETGVFRDSLAPAEFDSATAALAALLETVRAEGERAGREDERTRVIEVIGRSYGKRAEQIARVVTRVSEEARQFGKRLDAAAPSKKEPGE